MNKPDGNGPLAQAKAAVSQATETVRKAATTTAARAREEGQKIAEMRKESAADRVGSYGAALHQSAEHFEGKDPNIASFAHQAADRIESLADYVRNSDFATFRADAEGFARRNPAVFFGGMFVAGLVLGNVSKASQRRAQSVPSSGSVQGQDGDPA